MNVLSTSEINSFLKIDIVEAVNLHCKLNNEFHCNPYVIIQFEQDSSLDQSTHKIECTKNPKWEASFTFHPKQCYGKIKILVYQFLTPNDIAFIGDNHIYDEQNFMNGEKEVGYLGKIILEMEKLPFDNVDDWFLLETPIYNDRVQFPSCVHLRIKWTSTTCKEHPSFVYQSLSSNEKLKKQTNFKPINYIPMCKKDFAMIYKTRFSRLDTANNMKNTNELDKNKNKVCIKDPYQDYGFDHNSNLTSIEESLVYKIVKRNTGKNINFDSLSKAFQNKDKYVKSYREFFNNKCFTDNKLTKERINNILRNEVEEFPNNTDNPYVSKNDPKSYNEKMNLLRLKTVYNDTLSQFFILEDVKNLDKMDDDTYLQTLQTFSSKMKDINYEKKIDQTIFEFRNKVKLRMNGMVDKDEYPFFRIYALYKLDGGKLRYDKLKKEFILRPEMFHNYLRSIITPTNIIYNFAEDECPSNTVCIDPNGIVLNSKGENPRVLIKKEMGYLKDFNDFHFKEGRVDSLKNKLSQNQNSISKASEIDNIIINNKILLRKKKDILINRIFDFFPLLGEILGVCNLENIEEMNDHIFRKNERSLINKYILMWEPKCPSSEDVSDFLIEMILDNEYNLCSNITYLMDGLTFGDLRSIRVFKEIIMTVVMDNIITSKINNYLDFNLKKVLMKIFNKPFEFRVMLKVNFVNTMKITESLKDKLTLLIMKYDSNTTGKLLFNIVIKLFESSINHVNKTFFNSTKIINNNSIGLKRNNEKDFLLMGKEMFSNLFNKQANKLSKMKKKFKFQQTDNANSTIIDKFNKLKNDLKHIVQKNKFNESFDEFPLLQEYNSFQKGINNRTIYPKLRKHMNNMLKLNEIFDERIDYRKVKRLVNLPRFKSLNRKAKSTKSLMSTNFAKLAFYIARKQYSGPSQKQIIDIMLSNPDTRKMIDAALKNKKNDLRYSKEVHGNYEIINRKTIVKTVDENKKTKDMIKETLLDDKSFDDFITQNENEEVDDPTGLFKVLKGIQQRSCSCGYLCIEIGTIYGDWDSLRPKKVVIQTKETEDVNLVLKPIIIVNNINTPSGPNNTGTPGKNLTINGEKIKIIEDEDCDEFDLFKSANIMRFKDGIKPKIQRKFYRRVHIGDENYSNDIFKQEINPIKKGDKLFNLVFEKTYDTNNKACESEELARVIREDACNKIIVITGIGKWMGSMTPSLIREIKNIGGPDLKNTYTADFQDNEMADHAFILVGRRGLCAYNGVFRIKNYDLTKALKPLTPNLSSDPNDCYFEDVSLENMKNKESEGKFYHYVDFRFKLNLNTDNRFAWNAPSVTKVSPFKAHVRGGDLLNIFGYNFGDNPENISEIHVKNILCTKPKVISPTHITCYSGVNIFENGIGNVIIKLRNGLSSPTKTCNMFEYYGELPKVIVTPLKKNCVYTSPKIVNNINNLK